MSSTSLQSIVSNIKTQSISVYPNKANQTFTVPGQLVCIFEYSSSNYQFCCWTREGTTTSSSAIAGIPSWYIGASGYATNSTRLFLYGYNYAVITKCVVAFDSITLSTSNSSYTSSEKCSYVKLGYNPNS
jgi:hypothetical protein